MYKCPKCGEMVEEIVLLTYPPKTKYYCSKCGWTKVIPSRFVEVEFKNLKGG